MGVLIGSPQNKVQASEGKVCKKAENSTVYDIGDGLGMISARLDPKECKKGGKACIDNDFCVMENGEYEIQLYDPNCPGEVCTAKANINTNTFLYKDYDIAYLDDFYEYYELNKNKYEEIKEKIKNQSY